MSRRADAPVLVADVGGTNTRVGLARDGLLERASIRRYRNASHSGLAGVLHRYRQETGHLPTSRLCVAAAGLVQDGRAKMTNLDWDVSEAGLCRDAGIAETVLLNDLQAQGHGLEHILPAALSEVFAAAAPAPAGPTRKLVIGIGTGFNAAVVHPATGQHGRRMVAPSECGHISLPVADAVGLQLAGYLSRDHGMASVEDALSGRGLAAIDAWLATAEGGPAGRDAARVIAALETAEPRATAAVARFVGLLGHVAGDLALIHLPYGGLFLAGGVARAVAPHLCRFGVEAAFRAKGRMAPFMAPFSLRLIEDDFAALAGCAAFMAGTD